MNERSMKQEMFHIIEWPSAIYFSDHVEEQKFEEGR